MRVINIHKQNQSFTLDEANSIVKTLYTITHSTRLKIDKLLTQLENSQDEATRTSIENTINVIVETWQLKVKALGAETKGLYLADLPSTDGTLYCWKYPETTIMYHHEPNETFRGRKLIG